MKKTVHIKWLIEEVNRRNRLSTCAPQIREGWNSLLEGVLHEAGAYVGYSYLTTSDVPMGQLPGVVMNLSGNAFPDETRRAYGSRYS